MREIVPKGREELREDLKARIERLVDHKCSLSVTLGPQNGMGDVRSAI